MRGKILNNYRIYNIDECISFRKTNEEFGGLSNMASGYPIVINNIYIRTSEALYQAIRFSDYPEIQKEIIEQKSPMSAKMVSKKYRKEKTRMDWDIRRVAIMKWCLRVKLVQNLDTFSTLLKKTEDNYIVEESRKDKFWGAQRIDNKILKGTNGLGRLLMELREIYNNYTISSVPPLKINNFKLYDKYIENVKIIKNKDFFKKREKNSLF